MVHVAVFDDGFEGLAPLTDLRPSFALRSGAMTTAERLADQVNRPVEAVIVPPALATLVDMRFEGAVNRLPEGQGPWLLLNGRWPTINEPLPSEINTALVDADGAIVAALLDESEARRFISARCELDDDEAVDVAPVASAGLLQRPWDLLRGLDERLRYDLPRLAGRLKPFAADAHPQAAVIGDQGVAVADRVDVHPFVCLDATDGPIVLDEGAVIHPHSIVYGPCYIGRDSMLHARTDIGNAAIGPRCKLGGEISGSIIDGFSNKAHAGYLGDSYLGEWVNLGAGTITSNLKNTYGPVRARHGCAGEPEDTGMQFLGAIIADHVKTAIGTRLSTGTCLATGAMIALSAFPPRYVDRFRFLTDRGESRYELDRFALVADRMMQRRGQRVTADLAHRFAQLYGAHD